jgi:hypothetical protein
MHVAPPGRGCRKAADLADFTAWSCGAGSLRSRPGEGARQNEDLRPRNHSERPGSSAAAARAHPHRSSGQVPARVRHQPSRTGAQPQSQSHDSSQSGSQTQVSRSMWGHLPPSTGTRYRGSAEGTRSPVTRRPSRPSPFEVRSVVRSLRRPRRAGVGEAARRARRGRPPCPGPPAGAGCPRGEGRVAAHPG